MRKKLAKTIMRKKMSVLQTQMKKWFQGEMGGRYACAHACFYTCAQYLISDSLLIVYNLSEVSQSVVGDRVKTKIGFQFSFHSTVAMAKRGHSV